MGVSAILALVLHSGGPVHWDTWFFDPSILAGAFIVCASYVYGIRMMRGPGEGIEWPRVAAFFSGALLIFLALTSPLDAGSDQLLSLHMLQHVILASLGPPLVLLGLPESLVRRALGRGVLFRAVALATPPFVAATIFTLNMWLWHAPPAYELTLDHLPVHIFEHLLFMATGFLFWWPVIAPLPELSHLGAGGRLLYLFVTGFPMGLLALLLLSANSVVYSFYATGPRLWGVDPLSDQQVAGVIMGGLGEVTSFIAFSLLFWRYLDVADDEVAVVR